MTRVRLCLPLLAQCWIDLGRFWSQKPFDFFSFFRASNAQVFGLFWLGREHENDEWRNNRSHWSRIPFGQTVLGVCTKHSILSFFWFDFGFGCWFHQHRRCPLHLCSSFSFSIHTHIQDSNCERIKPFFVFPFFVFHRPFRFCLHAKSRKLRLSPHSSSYAHTIFLSFFLTYKSICTQRVLRTHTHAHALRAWHTWKRISKAYCRLLFLLQFSSLPQM